jgi:hypothetical protein
MQTKAALQTVSGFEPIEKMSRAQVVRQWKQLRGELDVFQPRLNRLYELRGAILGWYPTLAGSESLVLTTEGIRISECDNQSTVTSQGKKKLIKLWGMTEFLSRVSLALKQLPDPKDPQRLYTSVERTGPRHITALPALLDRAA